MKQGNVVMVGGGSGKVKVGLGSKHTFSLKGPVHSNTSVSLQGARHLLWMQILSTQL